MFGRKNEGISAGGTGNRVKLPLGARTNPRTLPLGSIKASPDLAGSVDDDCVDECARARKFQRGDGAVGGAPEDVRAVLIKVQSHYHSLLGYDNSGEKAWNVERGDGAVVAAHETVLCKGRIKVTARDLTRRLPGAVNWDPGGSNVVKVWPQAEGCAAIASKASNTIAPVRRWVPDFM